MTGQVELCTNRATSAQIADHLRACDALFKPPLSGRVAIDDYSTKIADRARRFEAWAGGELIGLLAMYCNDTQSQVAYVTSVSVLQEWQGRGIASQLLESCVDQARAAGIARIELEVRQYSTAAVGLYRKHGFTTIRLDNDSSFMCLTVR